MKSVSIILLFILFSNYCTIRAQSGITSGTSYLYWGIGFNSPPNDAYSFIDSLYVIAENKDTIIFKIKNNVTRNGGTSTFIKIKNKVSIIGASDTTLLYDFDLSINDTFILSRQSVSDQIILDSIVTRELENGIDYRHFYLHTLKSNRIIWVENIGEKTLGWDYRGYNLMDKAGLCAVCSSDSLVWSDSIYYWEFSENGMNQKFEKPGCNFYQIQQKVSLKSEKLLSEIQVYPVPAVNTLHFDLTGDEKPVFEIYDSQGRLVHLYRIGENQTNQYQIDVSQLTDGVYQLIFKTNWSQGYVKFIKESGLGYGE